MRPLKLTGGVRSIVGTVDYFDRRNFTYHSLQNSYGIQKPFDGQAYCGLVLTSSYRNECQEREFLMMKLSEPLRAGGKYEFSMRLSLGENSGYYTDQVGVHFLKEKLKKKEQTVSFLIGKADISNPLENYISDTSSWVEIRGIYNAKGGEKQLVVGNFQKCNQTSRKVLTPNTKENVLSNMKKNFKEGNQLNRPSNLAYYFIDSISLSPYSWNDSITSLKQKDACILDQETIKAKKENLVVDPSFSLNQDGMNPNWQTASIGTPDFLRGQVGLYLFSGVDDNNREYIISKLKSALSPCKEYFFSIKVKQNKKYKFSVDRLEVAFTNSSYYQDDRMIFPFKPMYRSPTHKRIDNTDHWITLCGRFQPNSCSKYLIIGNFSSDDETYIFPSEVASSIGPYAYYFIDDLQLVELGVVENCGLNCEEEEINSINQVDSIISESLPKDTLKFYFESSSYRYLFNQGTLFIEEIRVNMNRDTSLSIVVEGHADRSGNDQINKMLARQRANTIVDFLVKQGINKDKVLLKSFGSSKAIGDNTTEEDKRKSRRVILYYSKKSSRED